MAGNSATSNASVKTEAELAAFIGSFYADPYGFVMAVWPWGQPFLGDGSINPLADKIGPEDWQREELEALGRHIQDNIVRHELGLEMKVWKSAYVSGHGVGKSAFVAWLIYILMSTRADTRGAVTASTQFQLEDKTWPELAKWHNLALNKHWFKWTATTFSFAAYAEDKQKNYRTTAASVSAENTEAFAGLHNEGRTVFVLFDEASGVAPKVWEVSEGALTDGEAFFFALGNGTKPDGAFFDCFDKYPHLYKTRNIDSRSVRLTNKSALQGIIDKYGIDSDEVKVRIRGMFPEHTFDGFMDAAFVSDAQNRETAIRDDDAPLYMSVDVSNRGGDESVIGFRQGWDARSRPAHMFTNLKHAELKKRIKELAEKYIPDIIIIECVGIGVPMCDDLEDEGYKIYRAYPGAPVALDYVNNRALWWAAMRDWIYEPTSALEPDPMLYDQLTKIQYRLRKSDGKTLMESKEEMRERGLPSPDRADRLMLTFAVKLPRRNRAYAANARARERRLARTDYEPLDR